MYYGNLDWSPDGRWLAYSEGSSQSGLSIRALSVETGVTRTLVSGQVVERFLQPAFSSDGRTLAFTADRNGVGRLGFVRLRDDMRSASAPVYADLKAFEKAVVHSPRWRSHDREIIFISNKGGPGGHLWAFSPGQNLSRPSEPRLLGGIGSNIHLVRLSRCGGYLAYTSTPSDIDLYTISLRNPTLSERLVLSTLAEGLRDFRQMAERLPSRAIGPEALSYGWRTPTVRTPCHLPNSADL
jgi:Tol biopolymer transport system component